MDSTQLKEQINLVFDSVIDTVNQLPDDLFNKVPFESSWTIGQVAEHIVICSRGIPDHNVEEASRPYNENEGALENIFLDMNQKAKAAQAVTPQAPPHEKAKMLEQLEHNKKKIMGIAGDKDLMQLCLDMQFPFMGYLTRYEWLRFVQVHTQRHLNQIRNIQSILANQ